MYRSRVRKTFESSFYVPFAFSRFTGCSNAFPEALSKPRESPFGTPCRKRRRRWSAAAFAFPTLYSIKEWLSQPSNEALLNLSLIYLSLYMDLIDRLLHSLYKSRPWRPQRMEGKRPYLRSGWEKSHVGAINIQVKEREKDVFCTKSFLTEVSISQGTSPEYKL